MLLQLELRTGLGGRLESLGLVLVGDSGHLVTTVTCQLVRPSKSEVATSTGKLGAPPPGGLQAQARTLRSLAVDSADSDITTILQQYAATQARAEAASGTEGTKFTRRGPSCSLNVGLRRLDPGGLARRQLDYMFNLQNHN